MPDYIKFTSLPINTKSELIPNLTSIEYIVGVFKGIYIVTYTEPTRFRSNGFTYLNLYCHDYVFKDIELDTEDQLNLATEFIYEDFIRNKSYVEYLEIISQASEVVKRLLIT